MRLDSGRRGVGTGIHRPTDATTPLETTPNAHRRRQLSADVFRAGSDLSQLERRQVCLGGDDQTLA
jgi:hypothetical protein